MSEKEDVRGLLELVGLVVAPVTAVTAVLMYFGWNRQNAIYGYFGVDHAVLRFSAQDYLLRSVGVVFKPLAVVLGVLVLLVAVRRVAGRLDAVTVPLGRGVRLPAVQAVRIGVAVIALVWAVSALAGHAEPLTGALALALAAVLGGPPLHGTERPFRGRVLVGSVVAFAVFWAAAVHAGRGGTALAEHIDRNPGAQPALTVYSTERLTLPGETVVGPSTYRYTGLRLLSYANDRWVVITGRDPERGRLTLTLLRDTDRVRVEVTD
ncbi:hypothetical protein [Actinokineospora sp. UTMC 2448]|uniref:hypothetical protein n=1 Tax=Actinokineospora sp. UTMC 2448 TaxID=2268449 RepID=UPI002164D07B|nr:hypothetical protein [Actinokineospora sp. UTMC 2448]UVS81540.1 hypothetical protein Actkin_05298 [Actinokineospora sp. UTMC 2448]